LFCQSAALSRRAANDEPDPPHAIGLYFMTSLLLLLITGLARLSLPGISKANSPIEAIISRLASRLPF